MFLSGTCGAQGETLVEPFVAPRSFFSTISTFSTAIPVRAAGDCRPYRWRGLTPPPLYILYTVNKLRWATKASLTFRHVLRPRRPQPNGRGGSPLPPAATTRPRSGLSKNLFACVRERYLRSPRRSVSGAFCCSSEFLLHVLLISTANTVRAAGDCRPYRWTTHGPPPLHSLHFLHG